MKLISPIIVALAAIFCTPVFAGDDLGAGFVPESGKEITFSGQLDGKSLTCGKNKKKKSMRKCQRKFESVYDAANFSGTFRGYIEKEGEKRRNMRFAVGTVDIDGRDVRVIYQVDFRDGDTDIGLDGIFWLEPMSNAALRD